MNNRNTIGLVSPITDNAAETVELEWLIVGVSAYSNNSWPGLSCSAGVPEIIIILSVSGIIWQSLATLIAVIRLSPFDQKTNSYNLHLLRKPKNIYKKQQISPKNKWYFLFFKTYHPWLNFRCMKEFLAWRFVIGWKLTAVLELSRQRWKNLRGK